MKILFIAQSFIRYKGDITSAYLFSLAKELKTIGAEVSVLSPHTAGLPMYENIDGIKIYRFRYAPVKYERLAYYGNMHELVIKNLLNKFIFLMYLFFAVIKTIKVIKREKSVGSGIDILHSHWWVPSGFIAMIASKLSGKPYMVTSHGSDVFMLNKIKFLIPLAKMVFKKAKHNTAVSSKIKSILINDLKIEADKIAVFPMPCELSLFYPTKVSRNSIKTILSIGRLVERKGYNYLIEAVEILKNKGMDFKVTIVGEGPSEKQIKAKIESSNLNNTIEILSFKPKNELNNYYNSCDIFVLSPITDWKGEQEGLGLVLLEAMSCKKPVIATNSGGIPNIIKDGETGLLVPEKDSTALAEAIEKLLKDDKLRDQLSENGYKYVIENFTSSIIANKLLNIYSKVLR